MPVITNPPRSTPITPAAADPATPGAAGTSGTAPAGPAPTTPPATGTSGPATGASTFMGTTTGPAATPSGTGTASAGTFNPMALRMAAMGLPPGVGALLATDAGRAELAVKIQTLMAADPSTAAEAAALEKEVIQMVAGLNAAGKLPEILGLVANQAGGPLADLPPEKKEGLVLQLAGMIDAELSARGMTPSTTGAVYKDWESLSKEHLAAVHDSALTPAGPGNTSHLKDATFIDEMEALQGAKFQSNNVAMPLIDGPASFAKRKELIAGATESIHLMSWAFYDDTTGFETAKLLASKKRDNPDMEIKVMVDGQVAARPHHNETLKIMEDAGVEVVRWRDPNRVHDGQHRKMMIVDSKDMISGGMNVGDVYSHGGGPDAQKWRDTDMHLQGRAVADGVGLFAQLWNDQVRTHGLGHDLFNQRDAVSDAIGKAREVSGDAKAAVVNHVPGPEGDAHILLGTLKAIEGATESIDIENAYFISTPAIQQALADALERGVKVRLLTNSDLSVDEPIVSAPIMASLPSLIDQGAEVYVKEGDTLHSKFMVVDGHFSQVGSYNLHPRSHRYEGELMMHVLDDGFASQMGDAFEKDITAGKRLTSSADVNVPSNALSALADRYFFDQL